MKVKLIICFILGLLIACMFAICKQDPHQQAEIKILISILKDDNQPSDVRESAADELVTFGPAAVPALIDLIEENEPLVGHRAATLLGRLGPDAREAVPILVELLKNGDSMNCRQVGVLYAEGYQGEPKPGPSQLCVCDTASWALFYIGPNAADAVPELTKILREDERTRVRMNAAEALGGIGAASPDVVPALIQALQDESGNVPYTSAMALCDIGPEAVAAVPKLVALLNDDDSYVRYASIFALKDIGPEARDVVPAFIEALKDESLGVRRLAADALGALGPEAKDAIPALTEALNGDDDDVRQAAQEALDAIQKPDDGEK